MKRRLRPVFWERQLKKARQLFSGKKCIRVIWLEDFLTSKWPGSFTALAPPPNKNKKKFLQRGKGKRKGRKGEKRELPAPTINFWLIVVNKSYPVRYKFKREKTYGSPLSPFVSAFSMAVHVQNYYTTTGTRKWKFHENSIHSSRLMARNETTNELFQGRQHEGHDSVMMWSQAALMKTYGRVSPSVHYGDTKDTWNRSEIPLFSMYSVNFRTPCPLCL